MIQKTIALKQLLIFHIELLILLSFSLEIEGYFLIFLCLKGSSVNILGKKRSSLLAVLKEL